MPLDNYGFSRLNAQLNAQLAFCWQISTYEKCGFAHGGVVRECRRVDGAWIDDLRTPNKNTVHPEPFGFAQDRLAEGRGSTSSPRTGLVLGTLSMAILDRECRAIYTDKCGDPA